jgi:hypothetical protein
MRKTHEYPHPKKSREARMMKYWFVCFYIGFALFQPFMLWYFLDKACPELIVVYLQCIHNRAEFLQYVPGLLWGCSLVGLAFGFAMRELFQNAWDEFCHIAKHGDKARTFFATYRGYTK